MCAFHRSCDLSAEPQTESADSDQAEDEWTAAAWAPTIFERDPFAPRLLPGVELGEAPRASIEYLLVDLEPAIRVERTTC
jgi:hypothetical protein